MKIYLLSLLFLVASCSASKEVKENKAVFPLGTIVTFEGMDVNHLPIMVRGKVDGYNRDGTVRVLAQVAYFSESGGVKYRDSVFTPMNLKPYDLHSK